MAGKELDPITLQVISGALETIAEEMGHVLYRMVALHFRLSKCRPSHNHSWIRVD